MYKTEKEIFAQCEALKMTIGELENKKSEIRGFFRNGGFKAIVFTGCGSSYCVAKSAAFAMNIYAGIPSFAVSSGDLLLNADDYGEIIKDAAFVTFSRSGSTSEVVYALEKIRAANPNFNYLSVCAKKDSPLSEIANLSVEIPWAYDESVCQTRSVSNMYLAGVSLAGIVSGNDGLLKSLSSAAEFGADFLNFHADAMKDLAKRDWDRAVVLSDGVLSGVGEEAALAFKEICMVPSNYYNFLDVRHGPIVLIDEKTLVIAALSPNENNYQPKLIDDIKSKGALVIALGKNKIPSADYNAALPDKISHPVDFAAYGLFLLFLAQLVSFYKAINLNVNPDEPIGLSPWIKL